MSDLKSNTPEIKAVVLDPNMPATKPAETAGNKVTPPAVALPDAKPEAQKV